MKQLIKVKPNARENRLEIKDDYWVVWITAPAHDGKANKAIVKFLKKELGKPVEIISGATARLKWIWIEDDGALSSKISDGFF